MAVRHIFLWSVKEGHDAEVVLHKLSNLRSTVAGVTNWSIGRHCGEIPNSSSGRWQYALTCDLESSEALAAYQADPAHVAVVEECAPSYEDWLVLDYQLEVDRPESNTRPIPRDGCIVGY